MLVAFKIVLVITAIWIALSLACALRVARRRRTGERQVAGDPFFYPFGEMPIVPPEAIGNYRRQLDANDFSPSAGALRRNAAGERQVPSWMLAGRPSPGDLIAVAVSAPLGFAMFGFLLIAGYFQ